MVILAHLKLNNDPSVLLEVCLINACLLHDKMSYENAVTRYITVNRLTLQKCVLNHCNTINT